jgi:hypothetical protein
LGAATLNGRPQESSTMKASRALPEEAGEQSPTGAQLEPMAVGDEMLERLGKDG